MTRLVGDRDATAALELWGVRGARLMRATWGLNNTSWFVDADSGQYVLRLYATATQDQVASEHAFLLQLQSAGLSFATPRPGPARDGSTCPVLPGGATVVALFERIDGEHPDDDDVAGIEAAGAAFAELDEVLATMHTAREAWDGSIASIHPLVADLASLGEIAPECADFVRRMAAGPSSLRGSIRPRQTIHGDFAFGNVLFKSGRVVGVLDLEFLAEDARAAELATALRLVLSKGTRDLIWRPVIRGYLGRLQLTDEEVKALPTLALQHEAVVVAWWLGRYRSGMASDESLVEHVERALRHERWMASHASEVVAFARRCQAAPI